MTKSRLVEGGYPARKPRESALRSAAVVRGRNEIVARKPGESALRSAAVVRGRNEIVARKPGESALRSAPRLSLGSAFIVILLLSVGLWWAIWTAVSSLVFG